jgi:transposase
VGARARRARVGGHDEPGDPPARVDLQAKTVAASERDERARSDWRERVAVLDPGRLVFVDECGSNVGLTPLRARAPRGERARGKAPRNRGKNTTLLASMSAVGMGPCVAVEGATTARVFEAYVGQVLAPALRPGQVVVLDNLGAHKGDRVRELLEARGCELLFLPAYSPDFSPIEEAFSKLKARLRRERARTKEALLEAIGRALDAVSGRDARGFFGHCGYPLRGQLP